MVIVNQNFGRNEPCHTFNRNKQPVEIEVNAQGVYVQEADNPTTVRWFLIGGAVLLAQILLTAIGLTIRDRRRQQQLALEVLPLPPSPSDETTNQDDNHVRFFPRNVRLRTDFSRGTSGCAQIFPAERPAAHRFWILDFGCHPYSEASITHQFCHSESARLRADSE